ncbi:MAG: glycosyltransferase family 4 protein [Cyclobacteriaceae bacterium]
MKVLHLSSERGWRGGEQQIAYLLEEHKNAGIDSHVICKKDSSFSKYCEQKEWQYEEVGFKNSLDLASAIKIKNYCGNNQIDLVHMHGSGSHGVGVLSVALGNRTKLVLSRRVDFPLKTNFMSRWKYNHSSIKRILCVSDAIKEIVQQGIKKPEICQTIYSGIDLSKFDQVGDKEDLRSKYSIGRSTFLVGNTSALADHKDYFTFIDTAEVLLKEREDVHFIIFGRGELEAELKGYAQSKSIEDSITFAGFVENIQELLPQLDLFLMTSKTEGLGTSLLDAMVCKVPIVATRAGGIPEIIMHEKSGLLSEVKDSKGLAEQVVRLIENAELCERLVRNASEFVLKFDKKETARQTLEVYKDVLGDES